MRGIRLVIAATLVAGGVSVLGAGSAAAQSGGDELVTVGSPPVPFSQNKQNEPALAVDQNNPNVLVAGANDNIDMEACNAGDPTTCPFTPGVGVSGVYFSFDSGDTWTQPTYTGLTARDCLGPAACTAHTGPIGTLPGYAQLGLASDGDPAVAFGPRPGANGSFSWSNGSRLYYANLVSSFNGAFKGFEAIGVSRTDDVHAAALGGTSGQQAWMPPVLISKQNQTTFSDKEQVWADNAASSPHFGNVYVCWADFRSNSHGRALPTPLMVAVSSDGGSNWTVHQVTPATDNGINSQPDGCTVRTDSHGNVYVFGVAVRGGNTYETMLKSTNGGKHFSRVQLIEPVVEAGLLDPVQGRPTEDGVAGARNDLADAPSVDIANGAPTGTDATNEIVMAYTDASAGLNHEKAMLTWSKSGGTSWDTPAVVSESGDRSYYVAPAISPNGRDVYVTYNAWLTPYRTDTSQPRLLVGVVRHADVGSSGAPVGWTTLHRGASRDARGSSSNDLTSEFLGDYVYSVATRSYGAGVWNDVRNAADCPAIDAWRESLVTGTSLPRPAPQQDCPATFGNTDIYGGSYADPTP